MRITCALAVGAVLSISPALVGAQQTGRVPTGAAITSAAATLVLTGGKVFTADSTRPWAEALAIRGDRIVLVGTTAEVRGLAGRATREIALAGRVVIPGINDAHLHLAQWAPLGPAVAPTGDWIDGPSAQPLLDSLAALARRTPHGTWLQGVMGLRIRGDTSLRRAALDRVAPDHPVLLTAAYGHGSMVNTRALRLLGVADTAPDPVGGWYERRPGTRMLTGLLDGSAQYAAWNAYAATAPESLFAVVRTEAAHAAASGITTLQHMSSLVGPRMAARTFSTAAIPLRVRVITWPRPGHPGEWRALANRPLSARNYVSGVKYVVDGTPLEQWALMRQPYQGRPDWYGRLYYPMDSVRAYLQAALRAGDQPILHVVGDSTALLVLRVMAELAPDSVWRARRPRFEHGDFLTADLVPAARRMGIIIAQPQDGAGRIRMWARAGLTVAYGSDGAQEPFTTLQNWTTATDSAGAVTREEAVRMFTRNGARAEFTERKKGTLAPGMLADLAVLSQDIFVAPGAALPATRSVLTLVGGRVIYDALTRDTSRVVGGR